MPAERGVMQQFHRSTIFKALHSAVGKIQTHHQTDEFSVGILLLLLYNESVLDCVALWLGALRSARTCKLESGTSTLSGIGFHNKKTLTAIMDIRG